LKFKARFRHY